MYILSIPAFRWFLAKYTPSIPRGGHTCHGTNTNQMILIGGVDPRNQTFELEDGDYGDDPKDPWAQGIGVFDMTALEFKASYQAKAEVYQPAEAIREYYKVEFVALDSKLITDFLTLNRSNKYPNSWTSSAVKELIQGKDNQNTSNTTNPQISESKAADSKDRGSGLSLHVIIGIGVGCAIAGAIFAAAVAFIFTKRRKQRKRQGIGLIDLSGEGDYERDVETSSFSGNPSGKADHKLLYAELPAPKKLQEMPNPRTDITELHDTSKVEIAGKEKIPPVEV